jgi:hypothetical protein
MGRGSKTADARKGSLGMVVPGGCISLRSEQYVHHYGA